MSKHICAVLLFLVSCLTYAQDERAQDAPVAMADPIVIVLFLLVCFGGIAYYFWMVWHKDRSRSKEEKGTKE